MSWGYSQWGPYVPVAQKKAKAAKKAAQLAKKQGRALAPVKLDGRKITTTFWGNSWNKNLEAYSDYANRLPRGATYVRNGSVVDLHIKPKRIEALVAGSDTYTVTIDIAGLSKGTWAKIKQDCSASIDSLLDLLSGRFSDGVMQRLTRQKEGLFPSPSEIKMKCSCPDYSYCCKHLAAVMYGVGSRLDKQPELLFVLRDVDHQELVSQAVAEGNLEKELASGAGSLAGEDLGAIFGIDLDGSSATPPPRKAATTKRRTTAVKKSKSKTKNETIAEVRKKPKTPAVTKPVVRQKKVAKQASKVATKKTAKTPAVKKPTIKKKPSPSKAPVQ